MSYAKKLIKAFGRSPFDSLSFSLGKIEDTPDSAVYINAFVNQQSTLGDPHRPLTLSCPSSATKAERDAFIPLVIAALKRAQSIEELTSLLKPPAPLVEPIPLGVVEEDITGLPDPSRRTPWTAEQEKVAHETTLKGKLLCLLQTQGERHTTAIEAVLNSGLLPEPQLLQWLNQMVERAIRRVLGRTGIWEWELWAARWLTNADRSEEAAQEASDIAHHQAEVSELSLYVRFASWAALDVARGNTLDAVKAATYVAYHCHPDGETGIDVKMAEGDGERRAQYDDLFDLINEL